MKPFVVAVALVLLVGCTPKTPEAGLPPPSSSHPSTALGPVPIPGGPEKPTTAVGPVGSALLPARAFDESILRGREFLLEPVKTPGSQVRDPIIGPLGARPVLADAARAFFDGVGRGTVDDSTLAPRWREYLQAWVTRSKAGGWETGPVHVGKEREEKQGGWMVPVRILQPKKTLTGWVYLVADGKTILVSDVQVVESAPRTDPLDPESADQEISSPSLR